MFLSFFKRFVHEFGELAFLCELVRVIYCEMDMWTHLKQN